VPRGGLEKGEGGWKIRGHSAYRIGELSQLILVCQAEVLGAAHENRRGGVSELKA